MSESGSSWVSSFTEDWRSLSQSESPTPSQALSDAEWDVVYKTRRPEIASSDDNPVLAELPHALDTRRMNVEDTSRAREPGAATLQIRSGLDTQQFREYRYREFARVISRIHTRLLTMESAYTVGALIIR